jgi:polygalacturonase
MKLRLDIVLIAAVTTILFSTGSHQITAATLPEVKDLPVRKEMPEVLTMNDGTRVTTPEQWQRRREEMKEILEFYELGQAPPPPGNVTGQIIQTQPVLGGTAKFRLVHLNFGPKENPGFDIAIFTPAGNGPFPTIINPSFFMTPGVTNNPLAGVPATNLPAPQRFTFNSPVTPERGAEGFSNQLARGYAVVTYRYTECGADHAGFRTNSFYPAYPGYNWGVLRGWAWGLSRVVDYLQTQPFADKNRLIALGHSRLGKLTMVATAFDERIALGAPAGSSGAGTGAYRFCGPGRGGKEGIEDMTRKFPYYFVPRLKEFTGQMEKLPFDAHWFIALTAPRPWISIEGTEDQNCVPNAVQQSVLAAQPVYTFLGVSTNRVGVNYEPHRHALTTEDWIAALDFADQQLRGIDHHRRFNQFPPDRLSTNRVVFNVRDFGAVGNGTNKDTVAFQKALDACAVSGGGEVLVPSGTYLIGSVQIGYRTVLRLEANSVIMGSGDAEDYPTMDVRWEGRWQPGRRALIYSANVDHTGIIGPGRIEGNRTMAAPQNPRGAVVLEPVGCNDVHWEGFTVTQGGNWATHPTYCTDVLITNLNIIGDRDGIDVDSCKNVRIESCGIDTGDDCISLKSGRGLDGARIGRPTEDVSISRSTLHGRRFASVGIGSETSGGIRNVKIDHCALISRTFGVYIKTRIGRGGVIENISGDDLDIPAGGFLSINLISAGNKNTADDPVEGLAGYPQGRNFRFSNVHVACSTLVNAVKIAPEKPLDGLVLENIDGTCTNGLSLANMVNVELRNIRVTGCHGPCLSQTNVQGTGLESIR